MKDKDQLFEDILCEGARFEQCDAASRHVALRSFRRRHHLRLVAKVSSLAASVALAAALCHWPKDPATPGAALARTSPAPAQSPEPPALQEDPLPRVSDAELLAAFPPDSCFLVEVNGERILVFRDPELRKRYLE